MDLCINIDGVFSSVADFLRGFPSISITLVSSLFCGVSVMLVKRHFGYAGLCCCLGLFCILGNIQVLYATYYEILNMQALLGTVTLSASFMISDLINKHYGADQAKLAVLAGFIIQVLFFINVLLTIGHKPLDIFLENSQAIERIFLPIPRLLIASYIAYLTSQLSEIWLYRVIERIQIVRNHYIKHNISLFISSVVIDTLTFTIIGLVLLAQEPLSNKMFGDVCLSACILRVFCNFINSLIVKLL